ncbi:MAG: hypothetical protein V4543_06600 [Bacteroidota bacterium]
MENVSKAKAAESTATVQQALVQYIRDHHAVPDADMLCRLSGMPLKLVKKVIANLDFKPEGHLLRLLTDMVLLAIYETATLKNSNPAQKLWLQVMEGWRENSKNDEKNSMDRIVINLRNGMPPKLTLPDESHKENAGETDELREPRDSELPAEQARPLGLHTSGQEGA